MWRVRLHDLVGPHTCLVDSSNIGIDIGGTRNPDCHNVDRQLVRPVLMIRRGTPQPLDVIHYSFCMAAGGSLVGYCTHPHSAKTFIQFCFKTFEDGGIALKQEYVRQFMGHERIPSVITQKRPMIITSK